MNIEIETILDVCIDRMRAGEELETVLGDYPEYADELRPLLETAAAVEDLPPPGPSVETINSALYEIGRREGIREKQPVQGISGKILSSPWIRTAVTAVLVVTVLFWGLSTVSADSVPGQVLYPVKQLKEHVQVLLTFGRNQKAELRLSFSEERLEELSELFRTTGQVDTKLIQAMLTEVDKALDQYSDTTSGTPYLITKVRHLSETQEEYLSRIEPHVDEQARPEVEKATRACGMRGERMRRRMDRMMEHIPIHRNMQNRQDMRDHMRQMMRGRGR